MSNNIFTILTSSTIAVTALIVSPLKSQALTFNFQLDNTPDATVTAPIVGTGTFSFDGDPGDGTFALTALPNFNFSLNVVGNTFTNADLVTPLANILARIQTNGSDRLINFGGSGGGSFGGSVDFVNSSSLSFQPNFGSLYFSEGNFGTYQGLAQANVPTPIPFAFSPLPGLVVGGILSRLRRRKQSQCEAGLPVKN
jgi:hypothetical protein